MNFKFAFKSLWRQRTFTFLNLSGLVIGLTAFILIYRYISYELSYDNYHTKAGRIYRVVNYVKAPSEDVFMGASMAMGPALKLDYPEVQSYVRVMPQDMIVEQGSQKFKEQIIVADPAIFSIFSFPLLSGDINSVLSRPATAVISETAAKKYFGHTNPVGQVLTMDRESKVTITGVFMDIPLNSHFRAGIILSITTLSPDGFTADLAREWMHVSSGHTYILLRDQANANRLGLKLAGFVKKYDGMVREEDKAPVTFTLSLEPLKSIYLDSKYGSQYSGNKANVYIFSTISLFILIIAGINYINLITARSSERAKEVGIRKVNGSSQWQLIMQFLGESILLTIIAFILTIFLAQLLSSLFNDLAGKTISTGIIFEPDTAAVLLGASVLIGLLSGVYPALVLSSFKPATVLQGRFISSKRGFTLRQVLVVFQFTLSIALIIGTIVVYLQLNYMRNESLGFKKDQMLVIDYDGNGKVNDQMEVFKSALVQLPGVNSASASASLPGNILPAKLYQLESKAGEMASMAIDNFAIDEDFLKQFEIQLLAGRTFSKDILTDKNSIILNEAAIAKLGYKTPEDAIGKAFIDDIKGTVIGVVKDFHHLSLKQKIAPMGFRWRPGVLRFLTLNIRADNPANTVQSVEATWRKLLPNEPFNYYFLDQSYDNQYRSEINFGKLFMHFSLFTIFIACLGLLGLAIYATRLRTKEIGIRKILGASVLSITNLLSRDFIKLVIIAFFIAAPLASLLMNKWLDGFGYRISMHWWIFALAAIISLLVALVATSVQSFRAAMANPVKSLRAE